ncbi:hypothetical protein [Kribbella sp. CA-293567]|uniref:hypothetical protein n=1 Tax=Kribbella sp. CA-293567 TaxID=3002436 RepID=UPI0022DE6384|nr:hypothetical protein [Kribbella sp. CA-293567]WBQ04708.1 hypothetical protein OX958_32700 [Kribbella sp. CA-293567]
MPKRLAITTAVLFCAATTLTAAPAFAADGPTGRELLEKCDQGTDTCTFHPYGPPEIFRGDVHQVGDSVYNCTADLQRSTVKWSETTGESNSFGVSVSAEYGFSEVFKVSIETSYQHTWETSSTVGQDDSVDVRPGERGWIERATEMSRVKGKYEMHFPDRYYDHYIWYQEFEAVGPVKDAKGLITKKTAPMTAEEKAQHCG